MQNLAQMLELIEKLVLLLPENESFEHLKPKQTTLSTIEETKRMIEGFLTDAEVEAIQQENEQLKLDLLDTEEQIAELQRLSDTFAAKMYIRTIGFHV